MWFVNAIWDILKTHLDVYNVDLEVTCYIFIHLQMKPYKKFSFLSWTDKIDIHYVTSGGIMYVLQRIRKTYRSRWRHFSLFKMVSKVAVLMFIGQIILAFLLFYLLPKSEGRNNNVSSQKELNKNGQPIISLNDGKN